MTQLKLKSEILKDKNGKTISIEEFMYNDFGLITKQIFKDNLGNLKYYKTFEYDDKENCIKATDFQTTINFKEVLNIRMTQRKIKSRQSKEQLTV
jgi:hypothetical protein